MKKHNYDPSRIFHPKEELNEFIESKTIKHLVETKITKNHYENKIIIGDGLEAMAAMEFGRRDSESFKADIVMIDPPYNEDKSKGKYKDQWKGSGKDFIWAGENHGAYLDYLHPRIVLGKNSLTEEGCMMLFIGDGEQHRIRLLMEMIFGEKNYIGTIIWDSSSNGQKTKKINRNHEYIIIFAKNIKKFPGFYTIDKNSEKYSLYNFAKNLKNNGKSFSDNEKEYLKTYNSKNKKLTGNLKYITPDYIPFNAGDAADPRKGNVIEFKHPLDGEIIRLPADRGYRFSNEYLENIKIKLDQKEYTVLHDDRICVFLDHPTSLDIKGIIFPKNSKGTPNTCRIYTEKTDKKVLETTGYIYTSDNKKKGIKSGFETVKPYDFLSKLILNYPKKNAIVMDYFGGSGTTAIAVEDANKADQGNRSWVLVEMNENTVEETMIPRLNYFNIENYKIFKIEESEIDEDKLLEYFSNNLENYLKANYNYKEIQEKIENLNILGIEKNQLILYKNPDNIDLPRISKSTNFFKTLTNKYQLKSIKVYVINKNLLSVFLDLQKSLKKEGISLDISTIPEEFKNNWDNNLTILTGEKQ